MKIFEIKKGMTVRLAEPEYPWAEDLPPKPWSQKTANHIRIAEYLFDLCSCEPNPVILSHDKN